jgi:hypothetical protein
MSDPIIEVEPRGAARDYKIDIWLKDLLAYTPGAERKVVRQELLNTLRDFFNESYAWRNSTTQNLRAGRSKYYLSPVDAHTDVAGVLAVYVDGVELLPLPEYMQTDTQPGNPRYFYCFAPDGIELFPTPSTAIARGLRIQGAMVPNPNVKRVPAIAVTKFYNPILDGTLARMYSHPNKPYSSPQMAAAKQQLYKYGVARARAQSRRGFTSADPFSFPFFA